MRVAVSTGAYSWAIGAFFFMLFCLYCEWSGVK